MSAPCLACRGRRSSLPPRRRERRSRQASTPPPARPPRRPTPSSAILIGSSGPTRSLTRPRSGLSTTSMSPAARKTRAIPNVDQPPSSRASGASTTSIPNRHAGSVFSQSPPTNRRSRNAARTPAAESISRGGRAAKEANAANTSVTHADGVKERLDPDELCDPAEHRPEHRTENGSAECGPDHRSAPAARRGDRDPGERIPPTSSCSRAPGRSVPLRASPRCPQQRTRSSRVRGARARRRPRASARTSRPRGRRARHRAARPRRTRRRGCPRRASRGRTPPRTPG